MERGEEITYSSFDLTHPLSIDIHPQSMLESNTNFVLFVLVLSLLLVLSIFPIYSRFTHPLGNSDLLQAPVYCAFHLSTLRHKVNALSLTPLQRSGTHFQNTSDFLSFFL